jgi:LuxR family maltose regulon positive regulatory protein
MNLQVLLVDDHAVLRKGLRLLLEQETDLEVVGEAGDGQEAIELFRKLAPDVVVMDVSMKGLNGVEATRHIVSEAPATKVVALSIHSGRRYVEGMLDAGAAGYILKDSAPEDLAEGIRTVMRGEVFLSTAIVGIVVSKYRADLRRTSLIDGSAQLTVRNTEILRLLVAGGSDAQIAATLRLDGDSVATARRRLMDELEVHDEAELAVAAGDLGLLADEEAIGGRQEWDPDPRSATNPIRSTKLHRPSIPEDHIHRPRLVEKLNTSCHLPFTLISAPAGYGKSQLCSFWVSACGLPTAWVSLDEDDNDLRQFLRYFLAAVGSLFPDAIEETRSLAAAPILPPVSVLADALTNDLNRIEEDFMLVLDDFNCIRSEPVQDLITELLRHPPRPLHLMVITRRDPALPMARLRADQKVNEVRTRDLRFTSPETRNLLEKAAGLTVSDDALAHLEREVEGWVVGLRLVALALDHAENPEEVIKGMSGGTQQTQEYLLQEVIAQRSPQMQDWLLRTSILDRFCEPLCTAVCAVDGPPGSTDLDGGQFIDALLRCNLFTIPLDTEGEWFRHHHLFKQLLFDQLQLRLGPNEIATLRLQACAWLESQGLFEEAMEHALTAEDIETAAQIVERNLGSVMNEGRWHIIAKWLIKLPDSVVQERPALLLALAYSHFYRGKAAAIPPILDRIDEVVGGDAETHEFSGEVAIFRGACSYLGNDGARALKDLEMALDRIPVTDIGMRAINEVSFAMAGQMAGQRERVTLMVTDWLNESSEIHPLRKAHLLSALTYLDFISGDLEAVGRRLPGLRALANTHGLENHLAWSDYLEGLFHLQRGELDSAIRFLGEASERRYFHDARAAVDALAALTIAYQAQGQPEQAAASLQSLGDFATSIGSFAPALADSCAARLALMNEPSAKAVRWQASSSPRPAEVTAFWFEIPCVTRCRGLIAEGSATSLREAEERLREYAESTEAHHNTCQQIGILALQAVAFAKQDKVEEALTALERAIKLAQPGGFIFPFLELGPPMGDLLRRLPERDNHSAFVESILSAIGGTEKNAAVEDAGQSRGARPPLDQLTNRELGILELLGQRLFDKEIAAKLNISASTVNSHCKSIYQKLDVCNRRHAVAKGADLGIL